MRKALTAFIAASAVAFTVVCLPLATPLSAASCDDVKFIFARGSGQSLGDKEYLNFRSEIIAELNRKNSTLKYSFYELGSSEHGGAQYPAIALDFFNVISAKVSAGLSFSYGESVKQGTTELKSYISEVSATCKNTKFVIGGYSQGAQVITLTIPDLDPSKIIYAATFGDPKLYLPEGKGMNPDACIGQNLSPYREYAPNCRTYAGSLDAKKPYQPSSWSGKIGLWCKDKDLVCGAGVDISGGTGDSFFDRLVNSALSSHVSYPEDGIFVLAAKTIVKKLRSAYPTKIESSLSAAKNRDTVILIDCTGSMAPHINYYKKEALRLAKSTINDGGRVALYIYGDLKERKAERLVDFGISLNDFQAAIDSIKVDGGDDNPESMLSALAMILNQQSWRSGATKSIIALTDATYHSPDLDGTTLEYVSKRSLEIDPVNIYVVSNLDLSDTYASLTSLTGGQYFGTLGSLSTDYLLSRPNVNFPLGQYSGAPGQTFSFTAITEGEITSYDWDLDFDGVFETTTNTPTASKIYDTNTSGYIQVRANTISGSSSTASSKVIVSSTPPQTATITNLNYTISPMPDSESNFSADISFDFSDSAIAALVSVNDANLGFTMENNLTITDLTPDTTVTFTPISTTGFFGDVISIRFDSTGKGSIIPSDSTYSPSADSTADTANATDTADTANATGTADTATSLSETDPALVIPLVPNSGKL